MEIVHRTSLNSRKDAEFYAAVRGIGIEFKSLDLPGGKSSLITFEISESDANWPEVKALIERFGALDLSETTFSTEEILQAAWLRLLVVFQKGYPQPEATWVTNPINYEDFCRQCGTHRQSRPFRIAKEPKLGQNAFMTLIWGNPIFCTPEVINELHASDIRGFEVWDVLLHKTEEASEQVVQLFVLNTTQGGLMEGEDLGSESCPVCGEMKYFAHLRGEMRYRRQALEHNQDIIATHEWFGAGGKSAYREFLISNRLAKLIIEKGWRGIRMKVVDLVD